MRLGQSVLSERNSREEENDIFIVYRVGGEMDIYADGDRYGYTLKVTFTGGYTLYQQIYRVYGGEPSIRENLIRHGDIKRGIIARVMEKAERSDFFALPDHLPAVSPHEVEFKTPAETVSIALQMEPGGELKKLTAYMGVDPKYYPDGFLELNRTLRGMLQNLIEY